MDERFPRAESPGHDNHQFQHLPQQHYQPFQDEPPPVDNSLQNLVQLLTDSIRGSRQPSRNHVNLEYVVADRGSQIIIPRDCPENLSERRTWLKTVEILFENSRAGIRWIVHRQRLPCKRSETIERIDMDDFTFDIVVPLSFIFRLLSGKSFIKQSAENGDMWHIQVPDDVVQEISRKTYAIILSKIPESLRHLLEAIPSHDGLALIKSLRCNTNNIHQTLIENLRDRKSAVSLKELADWPKVKTELVALYTDWQQAVLDGAVDVGDSFTESSFKHFVADVCDMLLPGVYEWVHSLDNAQKSWRDCIAHCNILCRAQAKRLLSRRQRESTALLQEAGNAEDWEELTATKQAEADADEDAHSHYSHQRKRYAQPRYEQRAPYAGRGAGRTRDTWRGGYGGYAQKGRGSRGRGRGRGRGRSSYVMQRESEGHGKRKRGKLMTFDEWTDAFRAFQEGHSSYSYLSTSSTSTPPNTTHAHDHSDDGKDNAERKHEEHEYDDDEHDDVADCDEGRFQ